MAFLRPLLRTLGVQYILTARGGQDSNVPDPFTSPGNCSSHSTLNSSFLGMCSNPVHDQFSVWRTMQISGSTFQHHSLLPGKFWASQGSWITASFSSLHWYCCALSGPPVLTPICRTCVYRNSGCLWVSLYLFPFSQGSQFWNTYWKKSLKSVTIDFILFCF